MKADYDSKANAMSIDLVGAASWEYCEKVTDRVNVAIANGHPVNVEILYPTKGVDEQLRIAAKRYNLDAEALIAAAQAALAAPDRAITLDVAVRAVA
jgi:hypothetical protein